MRLIKFYRDGLRIWRWGWRVRVRWIRGFGVGFEKVHSPLPLLFQLRLGAVIVSIEHAFTWSKAPED